MTKISQLSSRGRRPGSVAKSSCEGDLLSVGRPGRSRKSRTGCVMASSVGWRYRRRPFDDVPTSPSAATARPCQEPSHGSSRDSARGRESGARRGLWVVHLLHRWQMHRLNALETRRLPRRCGVLPRCRAHPEISCPGSLRSRRPCRAFDSRCAHLIPRSGAVSP
jgi:hypothetical protein